MSGIVETYNQIPTGMIPEASIAYLTHAMSDPSILNAYNVGLFTQTVVEKLQLRPVSCIASDEQYLYYTTAILLEAVLASRGIESRNLEVLLANPSFRDWVCKQPIFQSIKSSLYWQVGKLTGRGVKEHARTHLQNSLRDNVIHPLLYFFYNDRTALTQALSRAMNVSLIEKRRSMENAYRQVSQRIDAIQAHPNRAADELLSLTTELNGMARGIVQIRPKSIDLFFQLLSSPKPNELINALAIYGLTGTSLTPLIYAKPNTKDLALRMGATVIGIATNQVGTCTVAAHFLSNSIRASVIPSRIERNLIRFFSTAQHSLLNFSRELKADFLLHQDQLPNFTRLGVPFMPDLFGAFALSALCFRSEMDAALYTPYALEHLGDIASSQWKLLDTNPYQFDHKLEAIPLQVLIGTISSLCAFDTNDTFCIFTAVMVTPKALAAIQQSRPYRSMKSSIIASMEGEAHPIVVKVKRAWKVIQIGNILTAGGGSRALLWGHRLATCSAIAFVGREIKKKTPLLRRYRDEILQVVNSGLETYGVYYRMTLAANFLGSGAASMMDILFDPSDLTNLASAATARATFEMTDSYPAAAIASQTTRAICNKFRVFERSNLQNQVSLRWTQFRAYSIYYTHEASSWLGSKLQAMKNLAMGQS